MGDDHAALWARIDDLSKALAAYSERTAVLESLIRAHVDNCARDRQEQMRREAADMARVEASIKTVVARQWWALGSALLAALSAAGSLLAILLVG